jgi:hypothetical protein
MDYLVVYQSSVKINAFAVEAALQRALHHIPLGRRLWRCVAMAQEEPDTLPGAALYKVFVTYSFVVGYDHEAVGTRRPVQGVRNLQLRGRLRPRSCRYTPPCTRCS